jgi:uncharacterized protein YgiM (DUF1202 family)
MRTKTLLSVAIAGLLMVLVVPFAAADRVKTTQTTKVMKRPGEKSAVVTRVKAGRTLTVIATQGRWMKVRVNGRTGWVARSTVKSASAREVPRNTRRRPFVDGRSTRRGWSGEAPDDRVGGDAIEDDEDEEIEDDEEEAERPRKKAKKSRPRVEDDEEDFEDEDDDEELAEEDCEDDECEEEEAPAEPKERVVMVTADKAKLRAKPSKKGKAQGRVKKGTRLVVLEEKKDWMLVTDPEEGDEGWIRTAEVWEPGMRPKRAIRAEARLGFERLSTLFVSPSTAELGNYRIAAAAASVSLRGDIIQKQGDKYLIGAELRYDLGKSTPGIRYSDGTNAVDIPYTTHDIDARLVGGYDFHHKTGAAAFGRLGYHYGMFAVANVGDFTKNLAKLPSETLSGPTIGVGAEAPRIAEKIGARLQADYLTMGKRAQTKGLEDGAVSAVKALWAGLVVTYQWKPSMTIDFAYGYEWSKTTWQGVAPGSMRGHDAESAARKDVTHGVLVGIAKSF